MGYREALPQLQGSVLTTDGGMETWLIFNDGLELPCFASFPLLESDDGRAALTRYFEPYLAIARRRSLGFVLEATTWRANPAWGAKRWIAEGHYVSHRVFFADEETAVAAGYQPCARCLPDQHAIWKGAVRA